MFERFTSDARAVVVEAQVIARAQGAAQVGAVHLLQGVVAGTGRGHDALVAVGIDPAGFSHAMARADDAALAALGIDADTVRARADEAFGPGALDPVPKTGQLRFAASGKRALREALSAAVEYGERRLDDGHVLLGVLRLNDPEVGAALGGQGVSSTQLREALSRS